MAFDENKHGNWHHFLPSSRIPNFLKNILRPWNTSKKRIKKHKAWHYLFRNRLPCEAIHMIESGEVRRYYKKKKKRAKRRKLLVKEKKWRIIFSNVSPGVAIKIIKEEWMPRPCHRHKEAVKLFLCFRFKECNKFHDSKKICPLLYILSVTKKGELKWKKKNSE